MWKIRTPYKMYVGKPQGKRQLGIFHGDNMKINVQGTEWLLNFRKLLEKRPFRSRGKR